jgi:hypothetical protein
MYRIRVRRRRRRRSKRRRGMGGRKGTPGVQREVSTVRGGTRALSVFGLNWILVNTMTKR